MFFSVKYPRCWEMKLLNKKHLEKLNQVVNRQNFSFIKKYLYQYHKNIYFPLGMFGRYYV